MAKRLSKEQIEELIISFTKGETVEAISENFKCSKLTIIRNLKKNLGEIKYKDLLKNVRNPKKEDKKSSNDFEDLRNFGSSDKTFPHLQKSTYISNNDESSAISEFIEIAPLNQEIDNSPQIDLTSISISEIKFPNIVYMIVDKKIELETKLLKDYPEWQFLSQEDLNRKTIKIYYDLKIAKRFCNKEQKVIKVPNTNVFKIASPFLKSQGITRIVGEDQLIAL